MSKRKRRNHLPAFKTRVALDCWRALKIDQTSGELFYWD